MKRCPRLAGMVAAGSIAFVAWAQTSGWEAGEIPADPRPTGSERADGSFADAFNAGHYEEARRLIERELEGAPKDPFLTYNLACVQAVIGEAERAIETLVDAIGYGFVDLHHMERDPNLRSLRDHQTYLLIMRGWGELLDARGEAELASAREALGEGYTYEMDGTRRLLLASAMAPDSFERAKREIAQTTVWLETRLFPDDWRGDPVNRPDPWVLVMLPTQRDFFRLGGAMGLGGFYDKDRKHLISQDIGPTLRHEYFHVLHWRHMDRLGQVHPYWMMEGLASLLEDVDRDENGDYVLAPSWRTNIAKRLERAGRLRKLDDLMSMSREHFMATQSRANYAQARALAMYLFDRGVLKDWYRAFVELYDEDASGRIAMESVLDAPLDAIERSYREWLRGLPEVAEQIRPASASLGAPLGVGAGDGPEVTGFVSRSAERFPEGGKLRRRDVILSIDGRPTPTLDDLHRVLSDYDVGQVVRLGLRRGTLTLELAVRLAEREGT